MEMMGLKMPYLIVFVSWESHMLFSPCQAAYSSYGNNVHQCKILMVFMSPNRKHELITSRSIHVSGIVLPSDKLAHRTSVLHGGIGVVGSVARCPHKF